MLRGKFNCTGPLLGDIANLKASLNIFGIFFVLVMVQVFLVKGLNKASKSHKKQSNTLKSVLKNKKEKIYKSF